MCKFIVIANAELNIHLYNDIDNKYIVMVVKNKITCQDYYEKQKEITSKFKSNKYKLAFINLLIPYAVKYYKMGLETTDNKQEIADILLENCKIHEFIKLFFEITNNEKDTISKIDFLNKYNTYTHFDLTWEQLLPYIRMVGLKCNIYDNIKSKLSKHEVIIGIKSINENSASECKPPHIKMILDNPQKYMNNKYTPAELYLDAKKYAKDNNISFPYTSRKVYIDLKKIFNKFYVKTRDCRCYIFPENFQSIIISQFNK
jgi:hypothetical protein